MHTINKHFDKKTVTSLRTDICPIVPSFVVSGTKNGDAKTTKNVGGATLYFPGSATCSSSAVTPEPGAEETTATVYLDRGVRYTYSEETPEKTKVRGTNFDHTDTTCPRGADPYLRSDGPEDIEKLARGMADPTA